jgi:hypothetical protein
LADWPSACPTRRVVACPLCACHDYKAVATFDRYGWEVNAKECAGCGLVYLGRTFTFTGAHVFYEEHYRKVVNAWHGKPDGYNWTAETARYRSLCCDFWPRGLDRNQWLDVGGEDVNPEHGSGLIELKHVQRTYDFVSCCQTMDHLLDPVTAFHKFAQLVVSGGHLWIDWVDYRITQELKADHPLNWTWRTVRQAIPSRHWSYTYPVQIDDRHFGLLLKRA